MSSILPGLVLSSLCALLKIDLLTGILNQSKAALTQRYGVPQDELLCYLHYLPQFYHLHVHISHTHRQHSRGVERAHFLEDIIHNLRLDSSYYAKKDIIYCKQ